MRIVIQANDEDYIALNKAVQFKFFVPFRCLGSEINTFMPYVQQKTGLGVIK